AVTAVLPGPATLGAGGITALGAWRAERGPGSGRRHGEGVAAVDARHHAPGRTLLGTRHPLDPSRGLTAAPGADGDPVPAGVEGGDECRPGTAAAADVVTRHLAAPRSRLLACLRTTTGEASPLGGLPG